MRRYNFTLWRWTSLFLLSYGLVQAILAALVGLSAGLPARALLLPYVLLLLCGFLGACLIYWARRSYDRPKSGALRLALATFLFEILYIGCLLVSAINLALLSTRNALTGYVPYVLPMCALATLVVYKAARRKLESSKAAGT